MAGLTWVGHSTVLIEDASHRVLTDPLLTRRVAHLRRRRALPAVDVTDVDLVLVSHAHMDHLHLPSLRMLRPGARVVTPRGTGRLVRTAGFTDVVEVVPGDRVRSGPAVVDVVSARHHHGRGPHSRVRAAPVGYVVDLGGRRTYFAGDTDLFDEMGGLVDIDLALLPIWGWGPTIGEGHLDPARAVEAARLIRPSLVVPIHWGTYAPEDGRRRLPGWIDDPADAFLAEAARNADSPAVALLAPGAELTPADHRPPAAPSAM